MIVEMAVGAALMLAVFGGVWRGRRIERMRALRCMALAFDEAPFDCRSYLACAGLRLRWQILFDNSVPGGAAPGSPDAEET